MKRRDFPRLTQALPWALLVSIALALVPARAAWSGRPVREAAAPPARGPRAPDAVAPSGPVRAVDTVGFTVSDLDRSVAFFEQVLTFRKLWEVELAGDAWEHLEGVFGLRARVARLALGDEQVELTQYLAPSDGRPIPPDFRSNDLAFQHVAIIVRDMDAAYRRLREHRVVHASAGPQRLPDWNPNAGGIEAFYFRDPDGHVLEVLAFPEGKGRAKWHRPGDDLFLGIDHTAIVVSDTDRSLGFYRDRLGFAVAGESENYGPEQERLNNVFGARLRITGLSVGAGPAIEFLEYLAPRTGRPTAGLRSNDLLHWQTTLVTAGLPGLVRTLFGLHAPFVAPGVVELPDSPLGFASGTLVRDPDGHALRLVERPQ